MLMEHTLQTLRALRLPGMLTAFEEQQASSAAAGLSFDERFAMLVDREQTWRENRRVARLLREARLKSGQACLEDVRYGAGRKLDRATVAQLGSCQWIRAHQNLILTGATGCGKTWLACALGNAACRQGLSVAYVRTPRLFEELRIAHGDGSFGRRLAALAKTDLLILDDWGLAPLNQSERNDLLEILDDRVATRSTLITSQLPVEHWHAYLNDPTLADAILDRVIHAAPTSSPSPANPCANRSRPNDHRDEHNHLSHQPPPAGKPSPSGTAGGPPATPVSHHRDRRFAKSVTD